MNTYDDTENKILYSSQSTIVPFAAFRSMTDVLISFWMSSGA